MPLYEYQCPNVRPVRADHGSSRTSSLTTCPTCGSEPCQKLFSAPAIQFKGTGWYITDYARKSDGKGKSERRVRGSKSEAPSRKASKSEGSKSEGSKSEGSKSEGSKLRARSRARRHVEVCQVRADRLGSSSSDGKAAASTTTATKDTGGGKSS